MISRGALSHLYYESKFWPAHFLSMIRMMALRADKYHHSCQRNANYKVFVGSVNKKVRVTSSMLPWLAQLQIIEASYLA
jgi:hypothetical protein